MQKSKLQFKIKCFLRNINFQVSSFKSSSGQALITLLFVSIIGIIITSAAIMVLIVNSQSTSRVEQGTLVYYIAESGIENALIRMLRNPSYTGETLTIGGGSTVISVSGDATTKYATSSATLGNYKRTISVEVSYNNSVMEIISWEEI